MANYVDREELQKRESEIREKIEEIDRVDMINVHDSGDGWICCQITFDAEVDDEEEVE